MLLQNALQYLADNKVINAVDGFGAQGYEKSLPLSTCSLHNDTTLQAYTAKSEPKTYNSLTFFHCFPVVEYAK
jgi:hypothetical protein